MKGAGRLFALVTGSQNLNVCFSGNGGWKSAINVRKSVPEAGTEAVSRVVPSAE